MKNYQEYGTGMASPNSEGGAFLQGSCRTERMSTPLAFVDISVSPKAVAVDSRSKEVDFFE